MSTYGSNNDNNSIWSDDDSSSEEEVDYIIRKWEDEDLEYEQQAAAKFKKKRNTGKRPGGTNMTGRLDYWLSTWGQMLRDPELIAPGSPLQKTFMRRFRVPYSLFTRLVDWTKGWHVKNKTDVTLRQRVPTELKVLGWLRMVGRSVCFDDLEELSFIKPSTMHAFFHNFNYHAREELYPVHVRMPSILEELMEIEAAYAAVGIPGACGSMDVVHIPLGRCPHGLINVCTGKEGYPTLGYNVICDHAGRALALMPGAYGTINDKTIVKMDDTVDKVKNDKLFTEYNYEVFRKDGTSYFTKGAFLIVDGGYLQWKALQCGLKVSSDDDYVIWRRKMESVRKDIECYFGRLKQRFRVLRVPNLLNNKNQIDNMMFSVVAVQNMVYDYVIAAEEMRSWTVQLRWQMNENGRGVSISEFNASLRLAEAEDIEEESDNRWFLPVIKKKKKKNGNFDSDEPNITDISEIGLRGDQRPSDYGWDELHVSEEEKGGF